MKTTLKPTLNLLDAVLINIGAIIGAGIFIVTGITAGFAGSSMILSMLIAALTASFTALSFASLTSWLPTEGSVYEYGYRLISPAAGFLGGWMWLVSNILTGSAVSLGFAHYLNVVLDVPLKVLATLLCVAFTVINYYGIRHSAQINNLIVSLKLLILVFFIALGFLHFDAGNVLPFTPTSGVLYGAYYIFFAYGGFARVAMVAEEVKEPERNIPKAILISIGVSTIIYLLVGVVALGLVGADRLSASGAPLSEAISVTNNSLAVAIVSTGGMLATASVLLTTILGVSRLTFSMSRKGDLPLILSKLHARYNSPYVSIIAVGFAMSAFILFFDLTKILTMSTFAMLFYYMIGNVSALRLRDIHLPRYIPVIGLLTCLILLSFSLFISFNSFIIGSVILMLGAVYFKLFIHNKDQAQITSV
ncbi:MAG TPA: amino acid permease [Candidatus Bathyarchaeia archaeon]